MTQTPDIQPSTWLLVALAPLLATGPTLGGSLALAIGLPMVAVAAALAARAFRSGDTPAAGLAIAVILGASLAVAAADALAAVVPAVGDGPARWLPLAVVVGMGLGWASNGDSGARGLPRAFAAGALALVVLAVAREAAARVSPVVLTPAGAFVAIGAVLAIVTAIRNRRRGTPSMPGPTP